MAIVGDSLRTQNQLLSRLLAVDHDGKLHRSARLYDIERFESVARGDESVREMLFPVDVLLSAVVSMPDGGQVDVGTIGREGAVGVLWLYGDVVMADLMIRCTLPGRAIGIPLAIIGSLATSSPQARATLDTYFRARHVTTVQLAACSIAHPVLQRCARLLLTMSGSVGSDDIAITQETISDMLGTRRATVTVAIATLIELGAITTGRANISILNRDLLLRSACHCYDAMTRTYRDAGFGESPIASEVHPQTG